MLMQSIEYCCSAVASSFEFSFKGYGFGAIFAMKLVL